MKVKIVTNRKTEYLFDQLELEYKEKLKIEEFSDSEISVSFYSSVRGYDLYILADNRTELVELLQTIDAAKRNSVKNITVILPYFGYGRQDKKEGHRGCLGASMMTNVLEKMGVNRIVSIDLHAEQIQGFCSIPFEHIKGHSIFLKYIQENLDLSNTILCSPDAGGMARVEKYTKRLSLPMVSINKRRDKPNSIASMELIGEVTDKDVIIIDDMVDTCGTLAKAVNYLKEKGAKTVSYIATHGVLSGDWSYKLSKSNLDRLVISDTTFLGTKTINTFYENFPKIEVVSCAPILSKVIKNLIEENSISEIND